MGIDYLPTKTNIEVSAISE